MKFVCDSCGTQYLISDEKVGPKGVKIRCKRCGSVLVLRLGKNGFGQSQTVADTSRKSPPEEGSLDMRERRGEQDELGQAFDQLLRGGLNAGPGETEEEEEVNEEDSRATEIFSLEEMERLRSQGVGEDEHYKEIDQFGSGAEVTDVRPKKAISDLAEQEEWYVAIADEQVGPLTLPEVEARWESGEINPRTLAWHPGMKDWTPLKNISKLRYLLGEMDHRGEPEAAVASGGDAASRSTEGEEWAPSKRSSLSSLVQEELQAVASSRPPASKRSSAAEEVAAPKSEEGIVPWGSEKLASKEATPSSEKFFDSSMDERAADWVGSADSGAYRRSARVLARPAYLSEGARSRSKKKLVLVGFISLLVFTGVGVAVIKLTEKSGEAGQKKTTRNDHSAIRERTGGETSRGMLEERGKGTAGLETGKTGAEKVSSGGGGTEGKITGKGEEGKAGEEQKDEGVLVVKKASVEEEPAGGRKDSLLVNEGKGLKKKPPAPKRKRPERDAAVAESSDTASSGQEKQTDKPMESPSSENKGGGFPKTLSKADIASTMKKYVQAMKACVQQQQQRDPTITGTMLISFVIDGSGKVTIVRILSDEHQGTYVAGCIKYIIQNIKFPKFSGDPVTVPRVPLKLGG